MHRRGGTHQNRQVIDQARDARGHGGSAPSAVLLRYAPHRKRERPAAHLQAIRSELQADGFEGIDRFYGERITGTTCWAHVRRKFFGVDLGTSAHDREPLDHIDGLYAVEQDVRGQPPGV